MVAREETGAVPAVVMLARMEECRANLRAQIANVAEQMARLKEMAARLAEKAKA